MKSLLQKTFENEFNDSNYRDLILNLFNSFDFSKEHSLKHQFNDAERQALNDFTYFGTYEGAEKKCLDVLTVELKSSSKVERARSLQRNLIGKYLKTNLKDSALVAFYSKDNPDWRLSFVKMDYRLDEKGVKVEIGTPPKRFSFLVGKTEPSHTAQKQLLPLVDDKKAPTLDEIEKSFSIEKVTKEFYTEIAKKFTELVGGERKIGSKKIVEAGLLKYPKPLDTLRKEFAVRLIGRLMFCWFLKKKKSEGGVSLIPNVLLSSDAISQYIDYYHSLLEPLFFQVLNTPVEKRNKSVRHSFWNNVPFLNGGLFEPHLHDYYEIYYESGISKYINILKIPDEWFLDLFKIFELYNFTIDESTTIDVDISVDPEMLGRIFENLLAEINPETGETARKATGSYYTPRPIVEYMVDESLKQYLLSQIPTLAKGGEGGFLDENKLNKLLSYGDYEIDLTESEKDSIIDALDRAKVIDPACGSGAFPMGILHKMLLILQKIDPESKKWLSKKLARIDNDILRKELEKKLKTENWDYVHKLGIIQNSIYGVDIQPIAVEISKLRFFLSLIVDERIDDDKPNRGVVPLPNLEFKFVAANSLIGLPHTMQLSQMELFEARDYIKSLRQLRDDYFASYGEDKRKIEQDFRQIQQKMFEYASKEMVTHKKTLETQTLKLSEWNPFSDEASSWFAPEWMFGVKDGFDVVIANPPYIEHKKLKNISYVLKDKYETYSGTADLYVYFYEIGINLLKKEGILTYISSNKFIKTSYGKNLRAFLSKNKINKVIDFTDVHIFEALVASCIMIVLKTSDDGESSVLVSFTNDRLLRFFDLAGFIKENHFIVHQKNLNSGIWQLEDDSKLKIKSKIEACAKKIVEIKGINIFRGVTTGCNEAFIIGKETKNKLISEDIKNKEIIKPLLQGRNIRAWVYEKSNLFLIFTRRGIDIKKFPAIEKYLYQFKENLEPGNGRKPGSYSWFEIQDNTAYYPEFEKEEKIIWGLTADKWAFAYDNERHYLPSNGYILTSSEIPVKYLLALLNNTLIKFFFGFIGIMTAGGAFTLKHETIRELPMIIPSKDKQLPFITLVDQILSVKQKDPNADTSALERQIDEMVYELYELSPEEIAIVEGKR